MSGMDGTLVGLLRCLRCGNQLERVGGEALRCGGCGTLVPIVGGVARFAGDGFAASFGRQWNRYDVARDAEDDAIFRVKTGVDARELTGKLVLDAGCGGGRYARLLLSHGAQVVGADLSSAVDKAQSLCGGPDQPDLAIVQADLNQLPLVEGVFDLVFSIGVLHHGPDPHGAFESIARRVKPGGRLSVWLYRKNTWPQEWANSALRLVSTRIPARILEPICAGMGVLGSIPGLNRTLNKVANFSNHSDWTLRVCDNFDWYAPRYQSHHTVAELKSWFTAAGFTDLAELSPAKSGRFYDWAYGHDLVIGSGVNVTGIRSGGA